MEHLPFLADEKQEEHHQARDECQADPDDGPSVVAGPCRKEGLCSHQQALIPPHPALGFP